MRLTRSLGAVFLVAVTGCSGSGSPKQVLQSMRSTLNPPPPPPDTIPEMLDYAADLQVNLSDMAKLPTGVLYLDLVSGDSALAPAAQGDSVEIGFDGWLPSGEKVDSGSAELRVGSGQVIGGIDAAIPGMRPGGRRKLVLPPGLAYGALGEGAIPPQAVLVYEVELRRVIR